MYILWLVWRNTIKQVFVLLNTLIIIIAISFITPFSLKNNDTFSAAINAMYLFPVARGL